MKKIKVYCIATLLLFSVSTLHTDEINDANDKAVSQQASITPNLKVTPPQNSFLSFFTNSFSSLISSIQKSISAVRAYFFRTKPLTETSTDSKPSLPLSIDPKQPEPSQETVSIKQPDIPQEIPLPLPQEIAVEPELQPALIKREPLLGVSYGCADRRLNLIFDTTNDKNNHYFNSIDAYQWSPQKKYIVATEYQTSVGHLFKQGSLQKSVTKLIDPTSNKKEIVQFNNIKMYEFSPDEKKLLILTPDEGIFTTFGITKPSAVHEDSTGKIKKTGTIFSYHIFDIATQAIIKSVQNATNVTFNNEDEITIHFEDGETEVHKLSTTYTQSLLNALSRTTSKNSSANWHYFPHTNELVVQDAAHNNVVYPNVTTFYFSPQKKYILLECSAPLQHTLLNTVVGINKALPVVNLIDLATGQKIDNFKTSTLVSPDTTTIITYEFSPQETKILLQTRGAFDCSYALFDIQQDKIIDQPIQKYQSVHFNNETEFTTINAQGNPTVIPINTVQKTIGQKLYDEARELFPSDKMDYMKSLATTFLKKVVPDILPVIPTKQVENKTEDSNADDLPDDAFFRDEDSDEEYDDEDFVTAEEYDENYENAKKIIYEIEALLKDISEGDINSPAIIKNLANQLIQLDLLIPLLSQEDQETIDEQQKRLEIQYKPGYTKAIKDSTQALWISQKNNFFRIATTSVLAALTSTIIPLVQIGTGNQQLNMTSLALTASTAIAGTFAAELSSSYLEQKTNTALLGAGSSALHQTLTAHANKEIILPAISPVKILSGAFFATVAAEVSALINQEGPISDLLHNNTQRFLVRKTQPSSENEIVTTLTPIIQNRINNPQVASFLAEVACTTVEAVGVAIILSFFGFGYANDTLEQAALRTIILAALTTAQKITTHTTGALITLPTVQVSSSLVNYVTKSVSFSVTPQEIVSSVIQAGALAATDLLVDQSGGFKNLFNKAQEKITQSVASRWSGFSYFVSNLFTMEEEKEETSGYGHV